jgi:hypothetical protein
MSSYRRLATPAAPRRAFTTARGFGYATVAYNAATGAQLWAKSHVGGGASPLTQGRRHVHHLLTTR